MGCPRGALLLLPAVLILASFTSCGCEAQPGTRATSRAAPHVSPKKQPTKGGGQRAPTSNVSPHKGRHMPGNSEKEKKKPKASNDTPHTSLGWKGKKVADEERGKQHSEHRTTARGDKEREGKGGRLEAQGTDTKKKGKDVENEAGKEKGQGSEKAEKAGRDKAEKKAQQGEGQAKKDKPARLEGKAQGRRQKRVGVFRMQNGAGASLAGRAHVQESQSYVYWPGLRASFYTLKYYGGRLMAHPITVHLIFYGNWSTAAPPPRAVIGTFVLSLSSKKADHKGPSVRKWWDIATRYTDAHGKNVSAQVILGETIYIRNHYKKLLSDPFNVQRDDPDDVFKIVTKQIKEGALPLDPNAFYAVITSSDVRAGSPEMGFCSGDGYCAWHNTFSWRGVRLKYAFIGDPTVRCNAACGGNNGLRKTANQNYGADSIVSAFAHELVETVTDFDFKGWLSSDEYGNAFENADLCAHYYLNAVTDANRTYTYNLHGINNFRYYVQANADVISQRCMQQV